MQFWRGRQTRLQEEIQQHIALEIEENLERGMPPEQGARRRRESSATRGLRSSGPAKYGARCGWSMFSRTSAMRSAPCATHAATRSLWCSPWLWVWAPLQPCSR